MSRFCAGCGKSIHPRSSSAYISGEDGGKFYHAGEPKECRPPEMLPLLLPLSKSKEVRGPEKIDLALDCRGTHGWFMAKRLDVSGGEMMSWVEIYSQQIGEPALIAFKGSKANLILFFQRVLEKLKES